MINMRFQAEACLSCNDVGFCMVKWGIECKRQGGRRIPRMKTVSVKAKEKVYNLEQKKEEPKKQKHRNKPMEMFEQIRTKMANW